MIKSEKLMIESQQEDNDFKSLSLKLKSLRESRSEKFIEEYLLILKNKFTIETKDYSYSITTLDFGIIDYFPKSNKLLIRNKNKWIKPGLKWIISNLLPS
jgi:hypothetical protein